MFSSGRELRGRVYVRTPGRPETQTRRRQVMEPGSPPHFTRRGQVQAAPPGCRPNPWRVLRPFRRHRQSRTRLRSDGARIGTRRGVSRWNHSHRNRGRQWQGQGCQHRPGPHCLGPGVDLRGNLGAAHRPHGGRFHPAHPCAASLRPDRAAS